MSLRRQSETGPETPSRALFFGVAGAAAAWVIALFVNVVVSGPGCSRAVTAYLAVTPLWMRIVLGAVTGFLLAVAIAAGLVCYRVWRRLTSNQASLVEAEGHSRQEYVALFGLFVSISLGLGLVWFVLPIYIIRICTRAH